jgi:hypothetical protein
MPVQQGHSQHDSERQPMTAPPATARSMWQQRFSGEAYLFGTQPNECLRDNTSVLPAGSVVCLATGVGRTPSLSPKLATTGATLQFAHDRETG